MACKRSIQEPVSRATCRCSQVVNRRMLDLVHGQHGVIPAFAPHSSVGVGSVQNFAPSPPTSWVQLGQNPHMTYTISGYGGVMFYRDCGLTV